jgi:hypothetical protein
VEVQELKVKPTLGFTCAEIVMVDCDDMPFRVVKKWARIVMEKCRLGGFIILKSSKNSYHVVLTVMFLGKII